MNTQVKFFIQWGEVIFITVIIKMILVLFSIIANPHNTSGILSLWIPWDGSHYIDIAKNWYQTTGDPINFIVFYPLYPILIKISNIVLGNFSLSAIIISWIFSISASVFLYELVLLDFNKRVALLSVWFLNIFPTAYFLQAAYTESLFLTTSLATLYFYRKRSFIKSGLIGALATMTRINGIILLPIFFIESKKLGKNLISLFLTPIGFFIYLLINLYTFHDPFYFSKILSSHWYKQLAWPWISIRNLINFYPSQTGDYYYLFLAELITIFLLAIATLLVYIKVRKSYGIYMFLNLLLFTSTSFIMSTPRYALVLFPIFILLAIVNNKFLLTLISIISLLLLFLLTYQYTQGKWAF